MTSSRKRQIVPYGVAVLASGTALGVRLVLTGYISPGLPAYLFFYPAVMLTATFYGLGPGLLATLASALLAAYFILPPNGFAVGSPVDLLGLVIFAWMGTGMSLVAGWYHRVRGRAARSTTELAGPVEEDATPYRAPHRLGAAQGTVPHPTPLRRWLTLLVLGTAVPLLAFAVVVLVWLVRGYQADQERRHADTTRALALAVDAEIRSWKAALQALAGSHELQRGHLAGFYQEARVVAAQHEGWIFLYDPSGQQQLNTRRPFGDPLPKTEAPELWQTFFRGRQPVVTDLLVGPVVHQSVVAVAVPVVRDGHVLYALGMAFTPERLTRLLAAQRFLASWVSSITDGQQKIVARVPERPDRLGQPVLPPFARAFAAQDSGTVETTFTDGRVGRSAFQRLREAPSWTVNVAVPLTELQAAWRRPVLAFLLLGGLAALGAVGLAVVLARKVARPVTEAARLAAAVIHGEAPTLPLSRIAEVADLQQALTDGAGTVRTALEGREQALIALREANQSLEARVTERTAALRDSEARFRALAGATFEGIAMAAEGRYVDANEQWCHLLGYRREELIGRELIADVATEDRDRVLQSIREGGASHFEHVMVRKDGTRMLVEVRGRTVQYQNRIVRVAAIRDVTDRHQAEAALRLSEEQFAKAFAANPAAMALTQITDGRILDTNAACLAVLGYAREELIGRSTTDAGIWCDPGARSRYVEALRRQTTVRNWEVQFASKAGQPIEVLLSGELITVRGEEVILSTFLDITARKQAEAALRESEERLRFALETSHIGAWDLDLVDHTTFRSLEHDRIFGYAALLPQWTYEMFLDHVLPEDRATVDDKFRRAMATTSDWSFECRIRDTTGQVRWIWAAGRHRLDAAGTPRRMAGIVQDITARKQAEAALRASEQRFRTLIEEAPIAISVSRGGVILYTNQKYAEVFGYPGESLRGRALLELWAAESGTGVAGRFGPHDLGPLLPGEYEAIGRRQDGAPFPAQVFGTLVDLADGPAALAFVTDITARKQAEAALQQAKEELEQRVQARTADLAQKARQLQALTAELALAEQRERRRLAEHLHDGLQQLLVAAKFRVTLLPRTDPSGIASWSQEMEHLLTEAIAASRTLTGELSPPILQTGGLMAGLEWLVRWKAEKYQLAVDLQADPEALPDSETMTLVLFQSVRELLFNIVKHAQVQAARVEVRQQDGHLRIVVSDQGVGFDPATLPATSLGGLGLSSIRQRLEYLGGTLEITSAPGQGSRFTLTVPLQAGSSAP